MPGGSGQPGGGSVTVYGSRLAGSATKSMLFLRSFMYNARLIVVRVLTVPVYATSYAVRDSSVRLACGVAPIGISRPIGRTTSGNGLATNACRDAGSSDASGRRSVCTTTLA